MTSKITAVTAAALAVAATGIAIPALSGADTSGARDITVREKVRGAQFVHAKPTKQDERLARGDRAITDQVLFDEHGKRLGGLFTDCVNVGSAAPIFKATLQCTYTYRLQDGSIVGSGALKLGDPSSAGAITGGTGAYTGASGTITAGAPVKGFDSVDVLHVAG
jgi:hypothetical protein